MENRFKIIGIVSNLNYDLPAYMESSLKDIMDLDKKRRKKRDYPYDNIPASRDDLLPPAQLIRGQARQALADEWSQVNAKVKYRNGEKIKPEQLERVIWYPDLSEWNPMIMNKNSGISTIVIDCDGCLTDGKKYIGPDGLRSAIAFNSRDNTAIQRLIGAGYRVVIVTAAHFSGIRRYWQKYNVEVFTTKEKELIDGIDWDGAVGIGDDLIDARFLRQCAWAFCPADAHPRLRAEFTPLSTYGGQGIMEEIELKLESLFFSENGTKYAYNGTID